MAARGACVQRSERPKPNRAQLKVFELGRKQCLDVFRITGEKQPVSHDMSLKGEDVSRFLLGHYFKPFIDVAEKPSSIVGLDKPDDIRDARWIWAWKRRCWKAASGLGRNGPLVLSGQKHDQQVDGVGRQRPHYNGEDRPHCVVVGNICKGGLKSKRSRSEASAVE
jgi:hypothetical protein